MTHPVYFRPSDAKQTVGVHRATIYRWADQGKITLLKHGRMTFVRTEEVIKLLENVE